MRKLALTFLVLAVGFTFAASRPFTFAVLGDRTGSAQPEVFRQILSELRLANPDFIVCTGDLIQGYTDVATTNAQWDEVLGQLRSTGIPYYIAPGNHDISSDSAEPVFARRIGQTLHSLKHDNSAFIFVDNSRWSTANDLPGKELRWLDRELAQAKKSRHTFVLMHRPYWRDALDKGLPELLQTKFRRSGVDYVFTGHDHFYCYYVWDGVRYIQVGPSGSRFKVYHEPGAGAFQNYLLCRVSDDSVAIEVRVPGQSEALPVDTVTYQSIRALEQVRAKAVTLGTVNLPAAGAVAASLPVTISNLTNRFIDGRLSWRGNKTRWQLRPAERAYSIMPPGRMTQNLEAGLRNVDSLYPLPVLTTTYEYAPGKRTKLSDPVPIRREAELARVHEPPAIDGRLTDDCWKARPSLRAFGSRSGGSCPMEPTAVWIARDDKMLYIAARCTDHATARLKADITARDGKVYEDDHLNVMLDFDRHAGADSGEYFQVFINPAGTIADRKCWTKSDKSGKSPTWNGNWRIATSRGADYWCVELACPLSDFGRVGEEWKVNASRYQSRTKEVAVWQAPFEQEPAGFGLLQAPD